MLPDKEVKKKFKLEASNHPDKYYPTTVLKKEGFRRKQCHCKTWYWTTNESQDHCGDPTCAGGFKVVSNNPSKTKLSYAGVWHKIVEMLEPRGYKPVTRYPVVARWNPTADFVMASIAAFQPYVITGEVAPPAKKLIIPQFSLRFGDVDNVGITGSHLTCFVMIGQHMFVDKSEWNQVQAFTDIYEFLTIGIGLPKEEITIHEDAWAGGGSFGPCMEFFSRGVELFNQVYTMFEQTESGNRELALKVLDMGLGMERIAWFSQGTPNIYEATFPEVLKKLRAKTNVSMNHELYKKFSAYSAFLNVDETDDIQAAWKNVADKLSMTVEELRETIIPMTALYSIAEHSRALLVALNDGALPSNVGGGYNLRVIFRRAQSFIDQFKWDVSIEEVASWHAEELKDLFPELSENLDDVKNVLSVELKKYNASKEKASAIVQKIVQQDKQINTQMLLELYDSNGINPEVVKEQAELLGKQIIIPDNFYVLVAEMHEKKEQIHATKRELDISIPADEKTTILYFENYQAIEFEATIKHVFEFGEPGKQNQYIILDRTAFYPTSGGQINDVGTINGHTVTDVIKQGLTIVHVVQGTALQKGQKVTGVIDKARRDQLTKHHSATHIINAAARKVLGHHINQIGAKKTLDKASLDITHYEALTNEQMQAIEQEANNLVKASIPINKFFLSRSEAEQKYGFAIYQGGAVPGNELRIVLIGTDSHIIDVECCAGTHLDNTAEAGTIKLLKSSKISDGVVRLVYVAGEKATEIGSSTEQNIEKIAQELSCTVEFVAGRAKELFENWKKVRKLQKKEEAIPSELFTLVSTEKIPGDQLQEAAKILQTAPEHVMNTILKFKRELASYKKE